MDTLKIILNLILSFFRKDNYSSPVSTSDPQDNLENIDDQDDASTSETIRTDQEDNGSKPTDIEMEDYSKLMVHLDNGHGKATPGKRSPSATTGKGYKNYTAEQLKI